MGSTGNKPSKAISLLYKCLLACVGVLVLALIAGTLYGLFNNAHQKNMQTGEPQKSGGGQTFTGIGQIRAPTADPQPATVILMVSFVYYPDDKAFAEELALRVGDFRDVIKSYFASYKASELQKLGDEAIKTEILRRFNAILRLGQIDTLYFSDFVIVS